VFKGDFLERFFDEKGWSSPDGSDILFLAAVSWKKI